MSNVGNMTAKTIVGNNDAHDDDDHWLEHRGQFPEPRLTFFFVVSPISSVTMPSVPVRSAVITISAATPGTKPALISELASPRPFKMASSRSSNSSR